MFSSVYRPPSADNLYLHKLIQYIERVVSSSYDVVFLGDLNLNTIKSGPDLNKLSHICNLFNAICTLDMDKAFDTVSHDI